MPVVTVLDAPEGLVEAQPRYTAPVVLGAFFGGLCCGHHRAERGTRPRRARRGAMSWRGKVVVSGRRAGRVWNLARSHRTPEATSCIFSTSGAGAASGNVSRSGRLCSPGTTSLNVLIVPRAADRLGTDTVVINFVPPPNGIRHARVAFVHDVIFDSHPQFFNWRERMYFKHSVTSPPRPTACARCRRASARGCSYEYAEHEQIDVVPNAVDRAFAPREFCRRAS